ncbi:hypothetical protein BDZ89DRAFT_1084011 [Hymenopellis radicata]|nr:hypothetical protein BDZ89DRAFT_1084011 [Hymenopellis radicata]
MSCSICRLPFIPGPYSNDPLPEHFPPKELCHPLLPEIQTVTARFDYCSKNFFCCYDGHRIANVMWESPFGFSNTVFMMHTACAGMFFHVLGVDDKNTNEGMTLIAQVVGVLGRPLAGQDPGRLRNVCYEAVGEQIDLRPFWRQGFQPGGDVFNWKALSQSKYNFLVVRPFIFPRLLDVAPSRTAHFATIELNNQNRFTTSRLITSTFSCRISGVLLHLLGFDMPLSSTTCPYDVPPHARRLVLDIPWSLPLPADLELMSPAMVAKVPDREKTPHSPTGSSTSPAMDPARDEYKRAFELAGREPTPAGECETQIVTVAW